MTTCLLTPYYFSPYYKKSKTMKKIFSILTLAAGVLATTSCSDFLDQTSPSEQTPETIWESAFFTEARVNQLYGGMIDGDRTYNQDIPIKWGLNTDIELCDGLGANATNPTHPRGVGNYSGTPAYQNFSRSWDDMYAIIEDANTNIEGIRGSSMFNNGTDSEKAMMQRYLGECLTIRAMIYFDILRYWGDVPLKLESSKPDLSNAYVGKTDRDDIMDTLMIDLEEAIDLLPWADDVAGYTTERITKGYAHALLAQMAMTRAGWVIREQRKEGYEEATEYSDPNYPTMRPDATTRRALYEKALKHWSAIITDGTHRLNPSFKNEWELINKLQLDQTYHENLFEIPFGLGDKGELGYTIGVRMNFSDVTTTNYGYGNSSGSQKVTSELFYSYNPNDTRRDITCSYIDIRPNTERVGVETMLGNAPFGLYVGKWDVRMMSDAWLSQNLNANGKRGYGINVVKMRYSQVLLYYAECLNELAGPDGHYEGDAGITAREALMQVHTRAFEGANVADAQAYVNAIGGKDDFFNALVQENAWELAGENVRKWDLIRWNLLVPKIMEAKQNYLKHLTDGTYQKTVYFRYTDDTKTKIDPASVTWYTNADEAKATYDALPAEEKALWSSVSSYGNSDPTKTDDTQIYTNLPNISCGLVGSTVVSPDYGTIIGSGPAEPSVINRYLMPLGSTTISASNGVLHNSYGYSD